MKKFFPILLRHERRGTLILLIFLLIMSITHISYKPASPDYSDHIQRFLIYTDSLKEVEGTRLDSIYNHYKSNPIDLNTVTDSALINVGIESYMATRIINYRTHLGSFESMEEVRNTYDMTDSIFNLLERLTVITPTKNSNSKSNSTWSLNQKKSWESESSVKKEKIIIDINKADTTEWKMLYGIGSVLAHRIVKFRDKLGGFHSINQVGETYGLSPETFIEIKSSLQLTTKPKKLVLDAGNYVALSEHPYITRKQAYLLTAYMRNHGPIKDTASLLKTEAFSEMQMKTILPYLRFDGDR